MKWTDDTNMEINGFDLVGWNRLRDRWRGRWERCIIRTTTTTTKFSLTLLF